MEKFSQRFNKVSLTISTNWFIASLASWVASKASHFYKLHRNLSKNLKVTKRWHFYGSFILISSLKAIRTKTKLFFSFQLFSNEIFFLIFIRIKMFQISLNSLKIQSNNKQKLLTQSFSTALYCFTIIQHCMRLKAEWIKVESTIFINHAQRVSPTYKIKCKRFSREMLYTLQHALQKNDIV